MKEFGKFCVYAFAAMLPIIASSSPKKSVPTPACQCDDCTCSPACVCEPEVAKEVSVEADTPPVITPTEQAVINEITTSLVVGPPPDTAALDAGTVNSKAAEPPPGLIVPVVKKQPAKPPVVYTVPRQQPVYYYQQPASSGRFFFRGRCRGGSCR